MAVIEELLDAGAFIPIKAKVSPQSGTNVDEISARCYRHPALGDSPVVKLSADNLATGDDLTMEFLGFDAPEVVGPVARRRRQALGFPEWALINDPKHARYALDLVKGFKKEARRARSKPGHAYEGFTEISRKLGKSVAHFLPSFWEQAGREFIAAGNATYASRAFGKAREAEKVHGLKVDEKLRQDAFLEFALAGCVSNKALTEYGKELLSTHKPQEAWTFFRELCIRRTLGGMPPWTSLVKDLESLIKSAELDPEEQLQIILAEVIDSPAMARAPMGFWKGASKIVARLAEQDDHIAGVLLNLVPKTSAWQNDEIWHWLKHLESWGILENAWKAGVSAKASPTGGAAAWYARTYQAASDVRQRLFDLLEVMADRMKKDKIPLNLFRDRWGTIEADANLLDLALSLKIKLQDPPSDKELEIDLNDWAEIDDEADPDARDRPRDLAHLAADQRFAAVLRASVELVAGDTQFEAAAKGKAGLTAARREWLLGMLQQVPKAGLPKAEQVLSTLQTNSSREIFAEFPEAYAALKKIDLVPVLTRTIQGGLIDEYGWPALEQVCDRYSAKDSKPYFFGHFPYAIVSDGLNVTVLRGDEVVMEAQLKLPKGHKLDRLMFLDGDLVVWSDRNYESTAWWHSQPRVKDKGWGFGGMGLHGLSFDLPGGGTFIGAATVHAGQKSLMNLRADHEIYHDGEHFWMRSWSEDHEQEEFKEVDPATGKLGRKSMPAWFEDYVEGDWKLVDDALSISGFGDIVAESPLGSQDGLTGFRVRRRKGVLECEGVDGRSFTTENSELTCAALLNQPGTKARLPIDEVVSVWDSTGSYRVAVINDDIGAYNRGQATGLPISFFHLLKVRDAAASKILRKITQKQVRELLVAEQADAEARSGRGAASESDSYPKLDKAIQKLLPKLKEPRLHHGLRGVVVQAGEKVRQLGKLIKQRDPKKADKTSEFAVADAHAEKAMQKLGDWYGQQPGQTLFEGFAEAADYFTGETDDPEVNRAYLSHIATMFDTLPEKLWRAVVKEEKNRNWLTFFEAWCDLPFQDMEGRFRSCTIDVKSKNPLMQLGRVEDDEDYDEDDEDAPPLATPYQQNDNRFLLYRSWGRSFHILQYAPTGKFESITGTTIDEDSERIESCPTWSAEQLRSFTTAAKNQPLNIPDIDFMTQLSVDMGFSLAEVVYIWFGCPGKQDYRNDIMPKTLREAYKLKVKECKAAKQALEVMPKELLQALTQAPLNGDPAELWEQPPTKVAERFRSICQNQKPERLELSDSLMEELTSMLAFTIDHPKFLMALIDPSCSSLFAADTKWQMKPDEDGDVEVTCGQENVFQEGVLTSAVSAIALLAYRLPAGHSALQKLAPLLQATVAALKNPHLIIDADSVCMDGSHAEISQAIEKFVGKAKPIKGQFLSPHLMADDGVLAVAQGGSFVQRGFRPAKLKTEKQYTKLQDQLSVFVDHPNSPSDDSQDTLHAVRLARSKDFKAIVDRLRKTPVPEGEYETNPLYAVPELVEQVAKQHKLSTEAAAYYLQILTLPDPSDKHIKMWNGWTAAAIKKLGKELVTKKLVLEAKRARAGRSFFLPGGWEALKSPFPPIESWKMPLFQMTRDKYDRARPPLARILPLEPVHVLFARAWKRIEDGDIPKYEEVSESRS